MRGCSVPFVLRKDLHASFFQNAHLLPSPPGRGAREGQDGPPSTPLCAHLAHLVRTCFVPKRTRSQSHVRVGTTAAVGGRAEKGGGQAQRRVKPSRSSAGARARGQAHARGPGGCGCRSGVLCARGQPSRERPVCAKPSWVRGSALWGTSDTTWATPGSGETSRRVGGTLPEQVAFPPTDGRGGQSRGLVGQTERDQARQGGGLGRGGRGLGRERRWQR